MIPGGAEMYLYDHDPWHRFRKARSAAPWPQGCGSQVVRWGDLSGLHDAPTRAGALVLYVRPTAGSDGKLVWSFDTADGRREYEKALHAHLSAKKIVPAKGTAYEPLSRSSDISSLASDKYEHLVLIVHSASNGPAIGVDLSGSGDWIKDDKVAKVLDPLGYDRITILGCDAVSNGFSASLAKRLRKGATVVAHEGGAFAIGRHFEPSRTIRGRAVLTRVSSNLKLKTFKTGS